MPAIVEKHFKSMERFEVGIRVLERLKGLYEYNCEIQGGPDDGEVFNRISRRLPNQSMKIRSNGENYIFLYAKDGNALFKHVGRNKYA